MIRETKEILMGIVAIVIITAMVSFVSSPSEGSQQLDDGHYRITATFNIVDGLYPGDDMRLGGINVGTVMARTLDQNTHDAVVTTSVSTEIKLPVDTVAGIGSAGISGGHYVRLHSGTELTYLSPGDVVSKTQDFRSLEDQVGEIIFLATGAPE